MLTMLKIPEDEVSTLSSIYRKKKSIHVKFYYIKFNYFMFKQGYVMFWKTSKNLREKKTKKKSKRLKFQEQFTTNLMFTNLIEITWRRNKNRNRSFYYQH